MIFSSISKDDIQANKKIKSKAVTFREAGTQFHHNFQQKIQCKAAAVKGAILQVSNNCLRLLFTLVLHTCWLTLKVALK